MTSKATISNVYPTDGLQRQRVKIEFDSIEARDAFHKLLQQHLTCCEGPGMYHSRLKGLEAVSIFMQDYNLYFGPPSTEPCECCGFFLGRAEMQ